MHIQKTEKNTLSSIRHRIITREEKKKENKLVVWRHPVVKHIRCIPTHFRSSSQQGSGTDG